MSRYILLFLPLVQGLIGWRSTSSPRPSVTAPINVLSPIIEVGIDVEHVDERGGISMGIQELGEKLGGAGRGRLVWDFYSVGADPANVFGPAKVLGAEDFESVKQLLPSSRRTQTLGKEALAKLESLYPISGGRLEGGVATISKISRSSDRTTKLLLRLVDELEVETVIIPWEGERSTLCISSQVGCSQGCKFCATGNVPLQRFILCLVTMKDVRC